MENDVEIFKGKTFSSLAKDIYFNSNHKKEQINQLINDIMLNSSLRKANESYNQTESLSTQSVHFLTKEIRIQ